MATDEPTAEAEHAETEVTDRDRYRGERSRRQDRAPSPCRVAHFSVAEREARGKAARAEVPRETHAEWEPSPHRPDPVDLLEEQAQTRVPELVPIRYGRMLVSPFTFYRGAAYLMASDLAGLPRTGCRCSSAVTRIFRISAASRRRTGGSC